MDWSSGGDLRNELGWSRNDDWVLGREERSGLKKFEWGLSGDWFNEIRYTIGLVWNCWLGPLCDGWQVGRSRNFDRDLLRLGLGHFKLLGLGHFKGRKLLGLGLRFGLSDLDDLFGVEVGLRC